MTTMEAQKESILTLKNERERELCTARTTASIQKTSGPTSDPPLADTAQKPHKNDGGEAVSSMVGSVHHTRANRTSVNDIYASCSRLISRTASTGTQEENGTTFVGAVTVHPRYRHIPTRSQGSVSLFNGSAGTHSRASSREQFSWDSVAWKEMGPGLAYTNDAPRDYLQIGRTPSESIYSTQDVDARPRRHTRSLAAWDRAEVEALAETVKNEEDVVPTNPGHITPIGRTDVFVESTFETAPLGHQHSFSLPSHKEPAANRFHQSDGQQSEREDAGSSVERPIMTHVMVCFKELYGVFYVPESEWATFNMGDLVTVESHTGENTGRVVCDLTEVMKTPKLIPPNIAQLSHEVLYPEDPSQPLEVVDPVTGIETLLRLPRVIRRGMNKGKKRLYYARRRDAEALGTCQRMIRERGFRLNVTGVEYQVDFKRITVFCAGSSSAVNRQEANSFIQHLAAHLRGSTVVVLFASDLPDSLEVSRTLTNGAFNALYLAYKMRAQESEASAPALQPPSHHQTRAPRGFTECSVSHPGPMMPMYGQPGGPMRHPVMMAMPNANAMYGMTGAPHVAWGATLPMVTPPPYGHPHLPPSLSGRL